MESEIDALLNNYCQHFFGAVVIMIKVDGLIFMWSELVFFLVARVCLDWSNDACCEIYPGTNSKAHQQKNKVTRD